MVWAAVVVVVVGDETDVDAVDIFAARDEFEDVDENGGGW